MYTAYDLLYFYFEEKYSFSPPNSLLAIKAGRPKTSVVWHSVIASCVRLLYRNFSLIGLVKVIDIHWLASNHEIFRA